MPEVSLIMICCKFVSLLWQSRISDSTYPFVFNCGTLPRPWGLYVASLVRKKLGTAPIMRYAQRGHSSA